MGNLTWITAALLQILDGNPPQDLLPVDFPERTPNHWTFATGVRVLQVARVPDLMAQAEKVCARAESDLWHQHAVFGFMGQEGVSNAYSGATLKGLITAEIGARELVALGVPGALDLWAVAFALLRQALCYLGREWRLPNGHVADAGTRWKQPWWEKNVSGLTLAVCALDGIPGSVDPDLRDDVLRAKGLTGPYARRPGEEALARLLFHEPEGASLLAALRAAGPPDPPGRLHRKFSWRRGPNGLEEIRVESLPPVKEHNGKVNLMFGARFDDAGQPIEGTVDWLRGGRANSSVGGEVWPCPRETGRTGPGDPTVEWDSSLLSSAPSPTPAPEPEEDWPFEWSREDLRRELKEQRREGQGRTERLLAHKALATLDHYGAWEGLE